MLFTLIGWAIAGLIIGLIARLLVPGPQHIGILRTMLLGVVGSFVGGFIGFLIFGGAPIQAAGWIGSIIGAVLVLWLTTRGDRVRT